MKNEQAYKIISEHIFLASRSYSDVYDPIVILANCEDEAMKIAKKKFDIGFERGIRLESLHKTSDEHIYEISSRKQKCL